MKARLPRPANAYKKDSMCNACWDGELGMNTKCLARRPGLGGGMMNQTSCRISSVMGGGRAGGPTGDIVESQSSSAILPLSSVWPVYSLRARGRKSISHGTPAARPRPAANGSVALHPSLAAPPLRASRPWIVALTGRITPSSLPEHLGRVFLEHAS